MKFIYAVIAPFYESVIYVSFKIRKTCFRGLIGFEMKRPMIYFHFPQLVWPVKRLVDKNKTSKTGAGVY